MTSNYNGVSLKQNNSILEGLDLDFLQNSVYKIQKNIKQDN